MMVITRFLKHKNLLSKSLLLGITILASQAAHARCVIINEYTMPNGRRVVCFGDIHVDSLDGAKAEQDAFIEVAKTQRAYCIVEDLLGYKGNNAPIQNAIDELCDEVLARPRDFIGYPMSAIAGLAARCAAEGIECHNAEYRYASSMLHWKKNQGRNARNLHESVMREIKEIINDTCRNTYVNRIAFAALLDKHYFAFTDPRCNVDEKYEHVIFQAYSDLFDLRLITHLEQVLADSKDNRPIFIFVGAKHSRAVDRYLHQKYHDDGNFFYKSSSTANQDVDVSFDTNYRVDIKKYFESENKSRVHKKETPPPRQHLVQNLAKEVQNKLSHGGDEYLEFYEYRKKDRK